MLIAIPYDNGMIFQHFGKTQQFKLYDVEDGDILQTRILSTEGHAHGDLAILLQNLHVEMIICGGMGRGMLNLLEGNGIDVYPGVTGYCDDAVDAYVDGALDFDPQALCNHGSEHKHFMN